MSELSGAAAPDPPTKEHDIVAREQALRDWFTRGADRVLREIDGLDIGWAGVQRWATVRMPRLKVAAHLDLACGYATFLAQLGWRFPGVPLVGLNIDYSGPHAQARELLRQAGVRADLVQADARRIPFPEGSFESASCFMGLQDVEIGFGESGVKELLREAVRVLRPGGVLTLMDEFTFKRFDSLLEGLPLVWKYRASRALDVRWSREVAERAIDLYAAGWVAQAGARDPGIRQRIYENVFQRLADEMEHQLSEQGYFVPFGPIQMVVARTKRSPCPGRAPRADRLAADSLGSRIDGEKAIGGKHHV
jgi:ubiquinone/menaquinone biosynthesis C-methylase UbiE